MLDRGQSCLVIFVLISASRFLVGLEALQSVGHRCEQIHSVNRSVGRLYIRTVYLGQRTDIESLGRATTSSPSHRDQIRHPLIPPRATSSSRGLLRS